jgi:hypothetical protein
MVVSTGTTIGLKATPGDGNTQAPQVTFAYKRAELAYVPTDSKRAKKSKDEKDTDSDAFSALAAVDVKSKWFFGSTTINQFISSGFAAQEISSNKNFSANFRTAATRDNRPVAIQDAARRLHLAALEKTNGMTPQDRERFFQNLKLPGRTGNTTENSFFGFLRSSENPDELNQLQGQLDAQR